MLRTMSRNHENHVHEAEQGHVGRLVEASRVIRDDVVCFVFVLENVGMCSCVYVCIRHAHARMFVCVVLHVWCERAHIFCLRGKEGVEQQQLLSGIEKEERWNNKK